MLSKPHSLVLCNPIYLLSIGHRHITYTIHTDEDGHRVYHRHGYFKYL